MPASEKIVSLFEPHTDTIVKGKRDVEYGHKINLATQGNGIVTYLNIREWQSSRQDSVDASTRDAPEQLPAIARLSSG